jgi:hypothetical protein
MSNLPVQDPKCSHGFESLKIVTRPSGTLRYRCMQCEADAKRERRRLLKKRAVDYLGGSCYNCGYSKCLSALEFHHVNPEEKDFSICSQDGKTFEDIKPELDKCILLCSNCHREVHADDERILHI